ncbi:tRNA preQ1(34) S-adenosylmethionine ribosyltransferase-isomerase QueA [Candidatus Sumerlaeota bacterium]|nr:tRNA preQ1(34) S-adenosylmethionine ribosyltransferase-isomerase QueA [Candidatus Sumerlaeota bacterium]
MLVDDFFYELPEELIAAWPAERRDESRLLVMEGDQPLRHREFRDLPEFLRAGDLLVMNDTRVIPARLHAARKSGGRVEVLLLKEEADSAPGNPRWRALMKPAKKVAVGESLQLGGGDSVRVVAVHESGERTVEFTTKDFRALLAAHGAMPIPPYIVKRRASESNESGADDRQRYQTIYARSDGSVAAPTAGLHFTEGLLARLRGTGIGIAFVTLHVGAGTFQTMEPGTDVSAHVMHEEVYDVPSETADAVARTRAAGGRVVGIGTTSVRTLESAWDAGRGAVRVGPGETRLMIVPGAKLNVVNGLVTNFHLPRSTLLLLVSAVAGRERILAAYGEAIRLRYRFYSYGDAMLILP